MKISIKTEYGKASYITETEDMSLPDMLELIKGLLITLGYSIDNVNDLIRTDE